MNSRILLTNRRIPNYNRMFRQEIKKEPERHGTWLKALAGTGQGARQDYIDDLRQPSLITHHTMGSQRMVTPTSIHCMRASSPSWSRANSLFATRDGQTRAGRCLCNTAISAYLDSSRTKVACLFCYIIVTTRPGAMMVSRTGATRQNQTKESPPSCACHVRRTFSAKNKSTGLLGDTAHAVYDRARWCTSIYHTYRA